MVLKLDPQQVDALLRHASADYFDALALRQLAADSMHTRSGPFNDEQTLLAKLNMARSMPRWSMGRAGR